MNISLWSFVTYHFSSFLSCTQSTTFSEVYVKLGARQISLYCHFVTLLFRTTQFNCMCCTLLGQSHAAQLQPSCTKRYKLQLYICINGLRTPGYSEFKWPGKTVNHCDIYPDFLQQWRRIQDHNPHFMGGMPLIFIKMDTINERGAICYCEEAHLIRQYVNIKYLHKQDTFTFTHMFLPFCLSHYLEDCRTNDTLS